MAAPARPEHAVVPVHIRKEVVKGQTLRGQPLQMGAQPDVEPAAAVAAAGVADQQQLGCFEAQGRAECPDGGGQRGRAARHGNAALVRQNKVALSHANCALHGRRIAGHGPDYQPHSTRFASSKAFCRL